MGWVRGNKYSEIKKLSCLKMEQAGIPREIRVRFRRLPGAASHRNYFNVSTKVDVVRCRIQHSIFKNV